MEADKILEQDPIFLDTETTGLYKSSQVVEVAVVDRNGHKLFESLVRPTKPIPAAATAIHGITNEMVARAPGWASVWPRLQKILAGRVVCIYNASFDVRVLRQSTEQQKMTWAPIGAQVCCVMKLYRKFYPSLGQGKAKKYSLATACRQFEIDVHQTHGALADAKLTADVFGYLARDGKPAPVPIPAPTPTPTPTPPAGEETVLNSDLNLALLTVVLAAAERLNERSPTHLLRIAALMERLAKETDVDSKLDRFDDVMAGAAGAGEGIELETDKTKHRRTPEYAG